MSSPHSPDQGTAAGIPWELRGCDRSRKRGLGKAGFAGELEERVLLLPRYGHGHGWAVCTVPAQTQSITVSPRRARREAPIPPSLPKPPPRVPELHLPQRMPLRAATGRATECPQTLRPRIPVPGAGLAPGRSEEGITAVNAPGSVRGEQKTAELYDSPIRHRELEERGLS